MARKRLREDWLIRVYRYHATPTGDLPQQLWTQAKAMQALWNELVAGRDELIRDTEGLSKEIAALRKEIKLSNPAELKDRLARLLEERKTFYDQFESNVRETMREPEVTTQLGWEGREFVLDRFRTASAKAFKDGATLHPKRFLDRIVIPHRYTSGGIPAEKLYETKGKVRLDPLDPDVYEGQEHQRRRSRTTRGVFTISPGSSRGSVDQAEEVFASTVFSFHVTMHRPLPANAILKYASWCGARHPVRGWQWTLQLTVELPPSAVSQNSPSLTAKAPDVALDKLERDPRPDAALDLGWRRLDDYLRIGILLSTDGAVYEIRLPLAGTANKDVRRLHRMIAKRAERTGEPLVRLPTTIFEIWELQTQTDLELEYVKEQLRAVVSKEMVPEDVQGVITNLSKVRAGGLRKLQRALGVELAGDHVPVADIAPLEAASELLTEWRTGSERARKLISDTRDRLQRRRRWYYEQIARWLANNFRRLIWEGDLSLREMAEQTPRLSAAGPDAALKEAAKFRQYASLYELRSRIERMSALPDNNGWLIPGKKNRTTSECDECGAACKSSASLYVTCENGHRRDQDVRSTRNLLAQIVDAPRLPGLASARGVTIPRELRGIIVPLD